MSDSPPSRHKSDDLALLCGPTEDRKGAHLLRLRQGEIQAGEVRPVQEGMALNGRELIRLKPRKTTPRLCDVEVLHPSEVAVRNHGGPAQVATDRYRSNWERIFALASASPDISTRSESKEGMEADPTKRPN